MNKKKSQDLILLDTSFLIALLNPADAYHAQAQTWYAFFREHHSLLFLSSIALAEFHAQQQDLGELAALPVIDFTAEHAQVTGEIWQEHKRRSERTGNPMPKVLLKDDFKIMAQASCENLNFALTGDSGFLKNLDWLKSVIGKHVDGLDFTKSNPTEQMGRLF